MQTYKKRPDGGSVAPKSPAAQAAMEGNINYQPTQADMGSRTDLPEAMRAKMEAAFGMDFSGVQLYQSQAVADAGANAMTMGNKIAFAPGKLDFSSHSGQALLGHELSHVASQARGEVSGQGFLDNSLLEARADREGAMAAAGESVYTGPVTPLSAVSGSTAMSAAGPMQAKKEKGYSAEEDKAYDEMIKKSNENAKAKPAKNIAEKPKSNTPDKYSMIRALAREARQKESRDRNEKDNYLIQVDDLDKFAGVAHTFRKHGFRKSVDKQGFTEFNRMQAELAQLAEGKKKIDEEEDSLEQFIL